MNTNNNQGIEEIMEQRHTGLISTEEAIERLNNAITQATQNGRELERERIRKWAVEHASNYQGRMAYDVLDDLKGLTTTPTPKDTPKEGKADMAGF